MFDVFKVFVSWDVADSEFGEKWRPTSSIETELCAQLVGHSPDVSCIHFNEHFVIVEECCLLDSSRAFGACEVFRYLVDDIGAVCFGCLDYYGRVCVAIEVWEVFFGDLRITGFRLCRSCRRSSFLFGNLCGNGQQSVDDIVPESVYFVLNDL